MNRQWVIYAALAAISIVAGVAIAGGPGALRTGSVSTFTPVVSTTTTTLVEELATVIESSSAASEASGPVADSSPTVSSPPSSLAPATTTSTSTPVTPTSTTTTSPPVTSPSTTTPTSTTTPDTNQPSVAVANGAGVAGIAGETAAKLEAAGYDDVSAINADPFDVTTVFYETGLEVEADVLAADAGFDDAATAPIDQVPTIEADPDDFSLILVLGADSRPPG